MPRQTRAVVFDAYGTLVEITNRRRPFKLLFEQLPAASKDRDAFAQIVMSESMGLEAAATRFAPTLPPELLEQLLQDLALELASVRLFEDVIDCLSALRRQGLKLAICSNLAEPYAAPINRLIRMPWDAVAWSFEVGAIKPQGVIYESLCRQLGFEPAEVLMVGDSEKEDYLGPLQAGMQAIRLRRGQAHEGPSGINSLSELPDLILTHHKYSP